MKVLIPLKYIFQHPLTKKRKFHSLVRFLYWQVISRIKKGGMIFQWIHGSRLFLKRGMHGATGNYYAYLHEFHEMSFLLHFLKREDVFWDIGANIGSYTILASKVAGARVVAFEPVPETYSHLMKNIQLNGVSHQVRALNIGLADSKGSLKFTRYLDTVNHVSISDIESSIQVEVDTCDNTVRDTRSVPTIIKLDVEGFEFAILKGSYAMLHDLQLQAIIIELNGLGNRFGFQDVEIHELVSSCGFCSYRYLPFERRLVSLSWPFQTTNVIYCRDSILVQDRLEKGMTIETPGFKF